MAGKKETFEGAVMKLDFLAKEDSVFNEAIAELDKKIEKEEQLKVQIGKVVSNKSENNK